MSNIVCSPISGKQAHLILSIDKSIILKKYSEELQISVDHYFGDNNIISIYECKETGYRFYYPFNIIGDEKFYFKLQNNIGYYPIWKWENEQALKFIGINDFVLDVGCGEGNFLKELAKRGFKNLYGIDLSSDLLNYQKVSNINITNQPIESFCNDNSGKYDIVTCFQVLEHTSDVKLFINSCISCLKPGGKLIIAVPNNNPFLYKHDVFETLNLPPHHTGLWDKNSLKKLTVYFNMSLSYIEIERLKDDVAKYSIVKINFLKRKSKFFLWFFKFNLTNKMLNKFFYTFRNIFEGRNIIAVFEKH